MDCIICDNPFIQGHWTDTHGICVCAVCGSPYRIIHYDDNGKRIDKSPECAIADDWINPVRDYYKDNPSRKIPSGFNIPGSSYEMCCQDDIAAFNNYWETHPELIPERSRPAGEV